MFTHISWAAYFTYVALALFVWYLFVGLRFYLPDIQLLVANKGKGLFKKDYPNLPQERPTPPTQIDQQEDLLAVKAEALSTKLKEAIFNASLKQYNQEEFLFLLQVTLKAYPEFRGTAYQGGINNLIATECEKQGLALPSETDMKQVWTAVQ